MADDAPADDSLDRALGRIAAAFDRFQEAHFWIHGLESYYHDAAQFRWHLNAFLRALKEVPQLLKMELQNEPGFKAWFREQKGQLSKDPLIAHLSKQRDIIVHQRMLVPDSSCFLGTTEMRGMKQGMGLPVSPLEDSDHAMRRYLAVAAERGDFLGILIPDEDSVPCVQRVWRLSGFNEDIVALSARAWLRIGETVAAVIHWLGAEPQPLSLGCRHAEQKVQFKLYDRDKLRAQFHALGGKMS